MESERTLIERGNRELRRKKRFFHRETVEAKVKSLFPNNAPAEILQLLDEYQPRASGVAPRVHLAILKLSNGDLELLRHHLDAAKRDYRDVILPAENPEFLRTPMELWLAMSAPEKDSLVDRDVQQYLDWLQVPRRSFLARLLSLSGQV